MTTRLVSDPSMCFTLFIVLGGVVVTLVLNVGVMGLLCLADYLRPSNDPTRSPWVTRSPGHHGFMLLTYLIGAAESLVFFASVLGDMPTLAGGWLVLKLGTKWKAWQHIVQAGAPGYEALAWPVREAIATKTASRFLAGTACNIVAALAGAYLVKFLLGFRS